MTGRELDAWVGDMYKWGSMEDVLTVLVRGV